MRLQKACLAAGAAVVMAAAAACEAKDIVITVPTSFSTLDPWDANDVVTNTTLKAFYEGLFTFDEHLKPVPQLAESYSVSPDGKTYTFVLKSGVLFHDGTPLNAQAVKLNFDRVLTRKMVVSRYSIYKIIDKVEAVDDRTVRFTLKTPFSAFIHDLALPADGIICPSLLEKAGTDKSVVASQVCGSGPYTLSKYSPSQYIVAAKNPHYHEVGWPKLDSITFRPTPEATTAAAMLKTGEAQFVNQLAPEQVASLNGTKDVVVEATPGIVGGQIYLNNTIKPFSDVKVREALNYAVNKVALCKVVYHGYCSPMTGVAPKALDYAIDLGAWPYDPKKARELLKEAGYPNGFEATLWSGGNSSSYQKMLQFLQQQFAQVGVKVQVRALEAGQNLQLMQQVKGPQDSKLQMAVWGWAASTGEIDLWLRPLLATESWPPVMANFAFYSNPTVDKAIHEALTTTDEKKKKELYALAQKNVAADVPWVFLYTLQNVGARNQHLEGVSMLPNGGTYFLKAQWKE